MPVPEVHACCDRDRITTLVHRLGAALDEGRFEDLRPLLTEDAAAHTPGGVAAGIDALVAQAARNHAPGDGIQHVISNVLVGLDGDRAQVRANLVATFARQAPDPDRPVTLGAVYRFEARRTAAGWRLTSVRSTPVWSSFAPVGRFSAAR
ncbi:nuclear transport factor 2 family protein [Oerskovia flava]|uniref:nuclear transport factor 2 family protein n=1 Tax=Oerskovia flava TaxID=2986422 RepID=UPI00223EF643|nr:nuclear transport factor 2 family protein [Oerskovia sp. JB1-3-2]